MCDREAVDSEESSGAPETKMIVITPDMLRRGSEVFHRTMIEGEYLHRAPAGSAVERVLFEIFYAMYSSMPL
jgi:hypothetical protein